jgi:hypothetical protein
MSAIDPETSTSENSLDLRLSYGPGMRWQRITEAALIVTALLTQDVRFAYVSLASIVLQVVSMRLALVALLVATVHRKVPTPKVEGVYFDGVGNRGGAVLSVMVHVAGIYLVQQGFSVGWLLLALPAGSFLLAPTVGFCLGCTLYVSLRLLAHQLGWVPRTVKGGTDVKF